MRFFHTVKKGVHRVWVDHPMFLEKVWGMTGSKLYGNKSGADFSECPRGLPGQDWLQTGWGLRRRCARVYVCACVLVWWHRHVPPAVPSNTPFPCPPLSPPPCVPRLQTTTRSGLPSSARPPSSP